jgi:hypothetical protein
MLAFLRQIVPHFQIFCSLVPDLSSVVYALGFDWLIHSTEASSKLIAASVTGELESIAEALLTNHKNGDVKLFFITIPEVNFLFDLIISYMRMQINGLFVFSSALEKNPSSGGP